MISDYCNQNGIKHNLTESYGSVRINVSGSYHCPLHKVTHQRENMFAVVFKGHILISCYRATDQEKHLIIRLNKPKKVDESQSNL